MSTVDGPCALPADVHSLISQQLHALCPFARRLRLRANPIFALCSDHCNKNNGNNEPNAFVNPFWVEHDLNPYIKPYRQYRSAFLYPEITPSLSQHPLHPILITSEANQSLSSTVSQGVDHATTVPSPSSQPHQNCRSSHAGRHCTARLRILN